MRREPPIMGEACLGLPYKQHSALRNRGWNARKASQSLRCSAQTPVNAAPEPRLSPENGCAGGMALACHVPFSPAAP
jgi:hypothetical protein